MIFRSVKGSNLTPAEVDGNFAEADSRLDALETNPPEGVGIANVEADGLNWIVTLTDSTVLDPVPIPVPVFRFRGEWAPFTLYSPLDSFTVAGEGLFTTLVAHTSAAAFDPDATTGSPPETLYQQIFPAELTAGLDDLSDVEITLSGSPGTPGDNDFIAYDLGAGMWTNRTPTAVTALLDEMEGDTGSPGGGVKGLVPAPADGDAAAGKYLDASGAWSVPPTIGFLSDLGDVDTTGASEGDFLSYSGSPLEWQPASPSSISDLSDAALPLDGDNLIEVSEAVGSPATSYESRRATIASLYRSAYNGHASLPASTTTAGWAITSNYDNKGEVDFWSTVNSDGVDGQGFNFYQKKGASTKELLARLYSDAASYTEIDISLPGTSNVGYIFVTAGAVGFGCSFAVPYRFYNQATILVDIPPTGGIKLYGSTSGSITLKTPAVAGSNTITFPAGTTDFSATGGTSRVVKQTTSGGAFTVAQLASSDISDLSLGGTLTTGGAFTVSGAFSATLTVSATTNSTLPAGTHTLAGLDVAQTWSANQQFNSGNFLLKGSSSGTLTVKPAAVAGTNTLTLPAGTTDFSATGGTANVVRQESAGAAFTVGPVTTGDLVATATNDDAAAGDLGEIQSSVILVASVVSLTTNTPANVTSLSLTAGDWDVWGEVWFNPAGTTTTSREIAAINTTSATLPTTPAAGTARTDINRPAGAGIGGILPVGPCRLSLSGTTTVYLVAQATFSVSTDGAYGKLRARRVR